MVTVVQTMLTIHHGAVVMMMMISNHVICAVLVKAQVDVNLVLMMAAAKAAVKDIGIAVMDNVSLLPISAMAHLNLEMPVGDLTVPMVLMKAQIAVMDLSLHMATVQI
jgi:hypothetical protein